MAKKAKRTSKYADVKSLMKKVENTKFVLHYKRPATKFIEDLKEHDRKSGRLITPEELRGGTRKTPRGAQYAERMKECQRVMDKLQNRGILARWYENMAASIYDTAAGSTFGDIGVYYRSRMAALNEDRDKQIQKLEDLVEDNRQRLPNADNDETTEINDEIEFLNKELKDLTEQINKPICKRPSVSVLAKL